MDNRSLKENKIIIVKENMEKRDYEHKTRTH
jgi:hypothetical protein